MVGRSREGAWIEIVAVDNNKVGDCGRSREGAWIEIKTFPCRHDKSYRRSREGAWIEMCILKADSLNNEVSLP